MKKNVTTMRSVLGVALFLSSFCIMTGYAQTNVFYDGFDDGDRTTNPAWYLIKAESFATVTNDALIGDGNAMQFNNEHSGSNPTIAPFAQKGVVAYLDNANTNIVSLSPGDSLVLSFDFRLQSVVEQSGYFRFGVSYDEPTNNTPFTADGSFNGSSNGDDDYSYFVSLSSGTNSSAVAIREDNATSNGYMSGADLVADKGSGSFTLNDTNAHQVVFTITRALDQPWRDFTVEIDGVVVATGFDDFNLKANFNEVGIVSNHRDLDFIVDNVTVTYDPEGFTAQGTPYSWLDSYGLVVSNDYETADSTDSDFDTLLNWEEYQCGTIPTNAASVLTINSQTIIAPNDYVIDWQSVPGKSYNLLATTNLTQNWVTNESGVAASAGVETSSTTTVTSATAFFVIELDQ